MYFAQDDSSLANEVCEEVTCKLFLFPTGTIRYNNVQEKLCESTKWVSQQIYSCVLMFHALNVHVYCINYLCDTNF